MVAFLVAGYLLARPSDSYSAQETASEVGFNHPQKYEEIHGGSGTGLLSNAVGAWKSETARDFDEVSNLLEQAVTKAGVAWEGAAAEAHGNSVRPMVSFVDDAKQVSTAVGTSTEQQIDNYTSVRDTMPKPKEVTATDSWLKRAGPHCSARRRTCSSRSRRPCSARRKLSACTATTTPTPRR